MASDVAIVILNYKTPDLTIECIKSLAPQITPPLNATVIVTDNASGDDSLEKIGKAIESNGWSAWCRLVPLPKNGGFSYGNNRGIELAADARYVLLLNSDTVSQPNTLRYCVEKMDADPKIGVLSALLLNSNQTVQNTARKFPTPLRLSAYSLGLPWALPGLFGWADLNDPGWDRRSETRDVDWVGGTFMMIRREAIDRLGGLDEGFFFEGEDAEFCHRVRRGGWKVRYDPGAAVIHLGGASSDPTRVAPPQREMMWWKARYLVQRRCYGLWAELLARGVDFVAVALRYVKLLVCGRKNSVEFTKQRQILGLLMRWPAADLAGKSASLAGKG